MLADTDLEIILDMIRQLSSIVETLNHRIDESQLQSDIPWQKELKDSGLSYNLLDCSWPCDDLITFLQKEVDKRKKREKIPYITRYQCKKRKKELKQRT